MVRGFLLGEGHIRPEEHVGMLYASLISSKTIDRAIALSFTCSLSITHPESKMDFDISVLARALRLIFPTNIALEYMKMIMMNTLNNKVNLIHLLISSL